MVEAPIIDGNFEATFNWQSAFENSGPETKASNASAMLQSGEGQELITGISRRIDSLSGGLTNLTGATEGLLDGFKGGTGITKLNSTQTFTGMPPIKIPITVLFRAWVDANNSVFQFFIVAFKK